MSEGIWSVREVTLKRDQIIRYMHISSNTTID